MSSLERQIQDVLEAVNAFASHTDRQFVEIRQEIREMREETGSMRSEMVTKTYLDEKIADLRGDLMLIARRGNRKLETVVEALQTEGVLPAKVAERILLMEPFPQR